MPAVIATHPGEPLGQIAALEKLPHHLRDDGTEITVPGLVTLLVDLEKGIEVP